MKKRKPPKLARWIFSFFLLKEEVNEKLGDLEEGFQVEFEERGALYSFLWFWKEVITAIPFSIKDTIQGEGVMLKNYFRSTVRNILKYKGYSFINVAGLAMGIACCLLIMLWAKHELSYDDFFKNKERIYRITIESDGRIFSANPWALIKILKKDYPEVEFGSSFAYRRILTRFGDRDFYSVCCMVSTDFFKMFDYRFIHGDPLIAFSNPGSVVLTERKAQQLFGSINPVGKTIKIDNSTDLTVSAVIQNTPSNSHLQFDMLFQPEVYYGEARMETWSMDGPGYLMLKPNVNNQDVIRKIRNVINVFDERTNNKYYVGLQPLREINLYALNGKDPIVYIYMFSSIAIIILLIACINFINLSTARSARRAKEIGLRKVSGAGRREIIIQFMGETFLLTSISAFFALLIVGVLLPYFSSITGVSYSLISENNQDLLLTLLFVTIGSGLFSGLYPSIVLSSFQPVHIFGHSSNFAGRGNMLRKILMVFQFSAAISLIVCTGIVSNQMEFIQESDLGFEREQILVIPINREARGKYYALKEKLLTQSGVINVSAASQTPLNVSSTNPFYWEGRSAENYENMNFVCLDYDYFETFDMDMKYGRAFSREIATDRGNYIINEAALKLTGYKNPIGKMFSMWRKEGNIVGVVKDFHGTSFHNEIRPIAFMLYENLPYSYLFIKLNSSDIAKTIERIKSVFNVVVPDFKVEFTFMDEDFSNQYVKEEQIKELFQAFSTMAIIISCMGLLGLVSYMTERRTREIAIRKVLGAGNFSILSLISIEFIKLALLANVISWPIAYYFMDKWLANFAYFGNISFGIFLGAAVLVLLQTLFVIGFQAIKAANKNPVDSIRLE